ncbi:unnamed protein product [Triticum turgidum subsp. durum]|uniref:Uncharacterized protein n=1 Tax=Triticum turgidum subsp. durum TaxID=4567 RepID=A0A9R0U2R9_TRITD|nr:unnamed protein product [Triticum turgidum subsp. durum]
MEKLTPSNAKKAMEGREEKPKVPSTDPDDSLADLAAGQRQPQLQREREHQAPNISEEGRREPGRPRASATQSADGPEEPVARPRHPPPPSTGDRDLDITGMSYIQ